MIKYEHDNDKKICKLEMCGTGRTITADAILMIKLIYDAIAEESKDAANTFKAVFSGAVMEGLPFMSNEEIDKRAEEAETSIKKGLKEILEEVLKEM